MAGEAWDLEMLTFAGFIIIQAWRLPAQQWAVAQGGGTTAGRAANRS